MLTDKFLVEEHPHVLGSGVQRIYRVGNYGLSLVNSSMLHVDSFAWEAAVIHYMDNGHWALTYKTPLTSDVEVFTTEQGTREWMDRAFEWFEKNPTKLLKESVVKGLQTKRLNKMKRLVKTFK